MAENTCPSGLVCSAQGVCLPDFGGTGTTGGATSDGTGMSTTTGDDSTTTDATDGSMTTSDGSTGMGGGL
jgi:hypothetical protein